MADKKILIVDDQKDFVFLMKHFFEKKGYSVIAAYNGEEALREAKRQPNIILLDLKLPDMDGFHVLQKLHLDPVTQMIPVIILTASRGIKSIEEAENLKATDYILKTDSTEHILAKVRKYISYGEEVQESLGGDSEIRKSGIDVLSDISWGKHICAFYDTKAALLSMLIPYFKAGLLNNELCFWVTSEGLKVEDAKVALSKEIENLSAYIEKGQMKIIDSKDLYTNPAGFDQEKAINFWNEEEKNALKQDFDGMRVSGSGNWAYGSTWEALCNYEKSVNDIIGTMKVIAICTYSFYKFDMSKIITVGMHHAIIIAKEGGKTVNFIPYSQEAFQEHFDTKAGAVLKIK